MRIRARNQVKDGITNVVHAQVGAEVSQNLAPGIVSVITDKSAKALATREQMEAHAVTKASHVMIETD